MQRIRFRLLLLLWIWAACMFVVVDLFRNVPEFDRMRPQARLYNAARYAAHKMVDEPYHETDFAEALPPVRRVPTLREQLAIVHEERSPERLRELMAREHDPRVRIRAMRGLSTTGVAAREVLLDVVRDTSEPDRIRAEAARFLGRTGDDAIEVLGAIVRSQLRVPVRAGAVRGLGELGTAAAVTRALELTEGPAPLLRAAAVDAIARVGDADAIYVLALAAADARRDVETRIAVSKALARTGNAAAVPPLADLLRDPRTPAEVRAVAADGLGRMGHVEAMAVVTAACSDASGEVSRQARIARTRLLHAASR